MIRAGVVFGKFIVLTIPFNDIPLSNNRFILIIYLSYYIALHDVIPHQSDPMKPAPHWRPEFPSKCAIDHSEFQAWAEIAPIAR